MKKNWIKNSWQYILLISISFFYFLWMNLKTPLFDDDLYIKGKQTINALYNQAYGDYMNWNGRAVGQTFWRILVANQGWVTSLLISLFSIIFIVVATRMANINNEMKYSWKTLLLFFTTFLFFAPVIGQTMFWRAGAGNYLFTTTLILLFVLPYLNWYREEGTEKQWIWYLMPILGFLAGWSNENTSGGGIFLAILFLLIGHYYKKINWSWLQLTSILTYLIGYAFLVLAPGNKVRTRAQMPEWWFQQSGLTHFKTGFIAVTKSLYHQYLLLLVLVVILTVLVIIFKDWRLTIESTVFAVAGMATIYVLSLAPIGQDGGRSFFGGIVFLIIALVKLLLILIDDFSFRKVLKYSGLVVSGLLIVGGFYKLSVGTIDSQRTNTALRERYDALEKVRGSEKVVYVNKLNYYPKTKFSVSYQLEELSSQNSQIFPNAGYNVHYDLKGIQLK